MQSWQAMDHTGKEGKGLAVRGGTDHTGKGGKGLAVMAGSRPHREGR